MVFEGYDLPVIRSMALENGPVRSMVLVLKVGNVRLYCQMVLDGTGIHTKSYGKLPLMVDLPNLKMVIFIVFCMYTRG